jgi:uncharacterized protein (TIGR02569 family)
VNPDRLDRDPPPAHVLAAYGVAGAPTPLAGGRGTAWRADDLVLKPLDMAVDDLDWQAEILGSIVEDGFRVSRPRRAASGVLVVDGWCAWSYCVGRHEPRRWADIVAVGDRFHGALADVPRPASLAARNDAWAIADRAAWGDVPLAPYRDAPYVAELEAQLEPLDAPSQLIHGDLTGNVLFADPLPPAVIDLSAYWRPPAFATAIVVADALVWEGADDSVLGVAAGVERFGQFLARALIFRILADLIAEGDGEGRPARYDAYERAVRLATRLVRDGS